MLVRCVDVRKEKLRKYTTVFLVSWYNVFMRLKSIELSGFKSFAKKTELKFDTAVTAVVGPNGSGKSNVAESFRFVLGEQSIKSLRGKRGEDLIWNGSHAVPRAGRASVRLVLDNTDRALALDFDEVVLERVVHRDGANEYRLNNASVRLKDISELLAKAGIGAGGHHSISQGEADRALSASPKERRSMLEDALGLTPFLYRREEAEKKLQKTAEHVREVESLRRELAPHLHFLQKQAKRIEDTERTREELQSACLEYFSREHRYLSFAGTRLSRERAEPVREKMEIDALVMRLRLEVQAVQSRGASGIASDLARIEREYTVACNEREELVRNVGRLEGEKNAFDVIDSGEQSCMVPASDILALGGRMATLIESALHAVDVQSVRVLLEKLSRAVRDIINRSSREKTVVQGGTLDISRHNDLVSRMSLAEASLRAAQERESLLHESLLNIRKRAESEKDAGRDVEKRLFEALSRRSELEAIVSRTQSLAEELDRDARNLQEDVRGVSILLGSAAFAYELHQLTDAQGVRVSDDNILCEPRHIQHDRRRKVERLKIRTEESGVANAAEIIREYNDACERDAFLERESQDVRASVESLRSLIEDLTRTLHERFDAGLASVSAEFNVFFKEVFGGGEASLEVVVEEEYGGEEEIQFTSPRPPTSKGEGAGVEVLVSLPHKRVKSLAMLSGGERALTSIALIFALSHINPPPFLILDETDAALDEANARRYGVVIERLSQRSQLIVVTHNRETMSHAGVLYGVTVGTDGSSKILSVRFDDVTGSNN